MTETLDSWPAGVTATMSVVYTQANAAGGAIVCEITPGAGNEFIILQYRAINSGTNGANARLITAAGGTLINEMTTIASGAGATMYGNISNTGGTGGAVDMGIGYPMMVSGTQALRIAQTGAGAQNDTFQILINIRLKTGQVPTVTHANSTNPGSVTVTAGAESFTTV